jgi:hypothetical protein
VWHPGAESNGRLTYFFYNLKHSKQPLQSAAAPTPDTADSNFKKMRQTAI